MSKTDKEKSRIQDEFDQIQGENNDFDISKHLAEAEDLPDLGEISLYDYDADLSTSSQQSVEVLSSLIDLYLSDVPKLKQHPYIKNKMKEDAMVYSEAIFLAKMTRKNFLNQLRQIDNGESSARMHEVVNQTIVQVRENSKFLSTQRTDLEKFYKDLRTDMGLDDIENSEVLESQSDKAKDSQDDGDIVDNRKLNDLIKGAMMKEGDNKKESKGKKK
jgi:hypothetical protein